MRQAVAQNDERAGRAMQHALGVTVALPFVGLTVTEGEKLIAVFVFNNFDRQNVDMSVVALGSLQIACIRDIARYVFHRLRVKRVTCVTHVENYGAIDRLLKLGFVFEGRLRSRFPQGDGLMFSLLKSEQRFVRRSNEQPPSARPLRHRSRPNDVQPTNGAVSTEP